jgi:hypothetical protein
MATNSGRAAKGGRDDSDTSSSAHGQTIESRNASPRYDHRDGAHVRAPHDTTRPPRLAWRDAGATETVTMMPVTGQCHCGQIANEALVDPERVTICHCTDCQRLTGTAYRVTVPAPTASFRVLRGTVTTYVKTGSSGRQRVHGFCPQCGSPIWSAAAQDPPTYGLRVGTLDQRADLPPKKRIWCRSALAWSESVAGVPGVATE